MSTYVYPRPGATQIPLPPNASTFGLVMPTAVILGNFPADPAINPPGVAQISTSLTIEEITIATSHYGSMTTRFFHLMFLDTLDFHQALAVLSGMSLGGAAATANFLAFYRMLTDATPITQGPATNPMLLPLLPAGVPAWLASIQAYFAAATIFFQANLTALTTTCYTMIVTADPNTIGGAGTPNGTVLSIGITAGLHAHGVGVDLAHHLHDDVF